MEVDQAVCSGPDCPHPPSLWGAALPLGRGRGDESALQREMGVASRHLLTAEGAGVLRSERCCTMVLACGTAPCLSILPAQVRYPLLLLKVEGVSSPESPPLLQKVAGREAVSWSGMGSLCLPLWYTPRAEGEGGRGFRALGRIPGPLPSPTIRY